MTQHLAQGEHDAARQLAHGLHGAAANLGAVDIAQVARAIETDLRAALSAAGPPPDLLAAVGTLRAALSALSAALDAVEIEAS
jgi:HPt (histidine-containing phosphotransfer) domain-containing protein